MRPTVVCSSELAQRLLRHILLRMGHRMTGPSAPGRDQLRVRFNKEATPATRPLSGMRATAKRYAPAQRTVRLRNNRGTP